MRTYTRKRPVYQFIENVEELCRLCLTKSEGVVPIFTDDSDNVCAVLALRIMICVGLEVKREECLPNIICAECLNNLNKYYAFRKKCEVSYQKLKSHVLAVNERRYKRELELQNEAKNMEIESEEKMKFVVSFDKQNLAQVSLLNMNGAANKMSELAKGDSIDNKMMDHNIVEQQTQESDTPEPDITTFISTMLLQLGILTQQENGLVVMEQTIKTLELETGDGSQVTLELVEEDEPVLVKDENVVMEHPLDTIEEANAKQSDVVIKYAPSNYKVSQQAQKSKKEKVIENKKNGAWCNLCGKQLASRSALNRHRRIHSGEKPYSCVHCGRSFGQKEVMLRHSLIHVENRPFACPSCPKSFTQRGALAAHVRSHAPPDARQLAIHRCSRCPKVFLYASGLSRHMMIHSGRVYVCSACERQFKDKSSLMRHLKNTNHAVTGEITAILPPQATNVDYSRDVPPR